MTNTIMIHTGRLDLPELEVYRIRNEVQLLRYNEPEPGLFVCESRKVIERALDAGYEPVSFLVSERVKDTVAELLEKGAFRNTVSDKNDPVPVYYGSDDVLREISGYSLTGGMLCAMRRKHLRTAGEVIAGKKTVAVLENVQNPTNVGSIFRSAAALGVEAILLTYDSSDPLYRRSERVSMGNVFYIPWTITGKGEDYQGILAENGFATVAMALSDDSVSISDPRIKAEEKLAIILGNEGYGLKEETILRSDYVAKIPMNPLVDSLNVGAASAVMFWELRL